MKAARILILGVAFTAGGAAAFLIGPGEENKPQVPRAVQAADMWVAQANIGPLSLALCRLFDTSKIAEGNIDRTVSAPFALVSPANI